MFLVSGCYLALSNGILNAIHFIDFRSSSMKHIQILVLRVFLIPINYLLGGVHESGLVDGEAYLVLLLDGANHA